MIPRKLTVSQVRVAASCPRIAYFDGEFNRRENPERPRVTQIWKKSSAVAGLGSLFHWAVEQFHRAASRSDDLRRALRESEGATELAQKLLEMIYRKHVDRTKLFAAEGAQQQAFIGALQRYTAELAAVLNDVLKDDMDVDRAVDLMFGDKRKRVDVTFQVGPNGEKVEIVGIIDHVFVDPRSGRRRIIDFKLTPSEFVSNDLFQVSLYALMHDVQHGSKPDVGLLYLHPQRKMVEKEWPQVHADRGKMYDFLGSLLAWLDYDETTGAGLKPPGDPLYCNVCKYRDECVERLGPKDEGGRLSHWTRSAESVEPAVDRHELTDEPPSPPTDDDQEAPVPAVAPAASSQGDPSAAAGGGRDLWIGHVERKDGPPATLPLAALTTHLTVIGAAGSGKTWLAKVVVEEAIRRGVPVVAVDPQGDLVQFLRRRDRRLFTAAEQGAFDDFAQRVEPRVFTPGASHGVRLSLNPIRLADDRDLQSLRDPRRRQEEKEGIFRSVASNLAQLARMGGERDSQETFLFEALRRLSELHGAHEVSLESLIAVARDPESVGMEDADAFIRKAEREKLARKLTTLSRGVSANLFSGGVPLDIDRLRAPLTPGKTPLNVIYLNALPSDDQKQFFVASLAAEIYRWMVTSSSSPGPQLLFYIDEARDYAPSGSKQPPAKTPIRRLFSQGRKYGVCCLICTQSPRSVDYEIFSNCSAKIIGRLESQQDVDRVREWFSHDGRPPDWLAGRKGAEKGTFIARWPAMDPSLDGRTIVSRALFSLHESAWSPDRVEAEMADESSRAAWEQTNSFQGDLSPTGRK